MMDQVERPFITPPDKQASPPINELVCFLDKDRACGPDCMSFTLNTPGADYNDPWAHCIVLASAFRISKHLVILAQQGGERLSIHKTSTADQVRSNNAPVIPPFMPPGKEQP